MKLKNKIKFFIILIAICAPISYITWLSMRPVEIIAIHNRSSHFNSVIVKNFPFTDRGKITWWLKNKEILKDKYNIPNPGPDGTFYLTFWLFGDGYKEEEKYDRLCFKDMKTKKNCIEKDIVFSVDNSRNMGMMFKVYDGTYRLQKNGEVVKYVDHYEVW